MLQKAMRDSGFVERIAALMSRAVRVPRPLTVASLECGQPNAYYSSGNREIVLCLELFADLVQRAPSALPPNASKDEVGEIVAGTLAFILLHELAHALVDLHQLPVLGREEDAADQVSTFILLHSEVAKPALTGAMWFFGRKEATYTQRHFSDEHGLGPQRQANIACWAVGKDATKFAFLLKLGVLSPERTQRCTREFQQLDRSVRTLLGGAFKAMPR